MQRRKQTWLWTAAILQLLTSLVHATTFFAKEVPANDTERQLHELLVTYKKDLGAGFSRTFMDLFTALSACFTLLYFFGGLLNVYFARRKIEPGLLKGILNINVIVFGISFALMLIFTFIFPIAFTALVFVALLLARFTLRTK